MNTPHDDFQSPAPASPQPQHQPPGQIPGQASGGFGRRAVILGAMALVMGPIAYVETPREVARWYEAAAIQEHADRNLPLANDLLDKALDWDPRAASAYARRGEWRLERNDYLGSLAQYDRALELNPDSLDIRMQRCTALQFLGRHDEAVAQWKEIDQRTAGRSLQERGEVLNGLAYAKALGAVELKSALQEIDKAMRFVNENAAMLDTRGFIHYQLGDDEAALADLDVAVREINKQYERFTAGIDHNLAQLPKMFVAEVRDQPRLFRRSVAVLHYHRGLIYERLGRQQEADTDFERVRELGFEPGDDLF